MNCLGMDRQVMNGWIDGFQEWIDGWTILTCTNLTALKYSKEIKAATGDSTLSDGGDTFFLIRSDPYMEKNYRPHIQVGQLLDKPRDNH